MAYQITGSNVRHLTDLEKKYALLGRSEAVFQAFCDDFSKSLGADSALFFLLKEVRKTLPFFERYPAPFHQSFTAEFVNDEPAVNNFIIEHSCKFVEFAELVKLGLFFVETADYPTIRTLIVPLMRGNKLVGFFLIIEPTVDAEIINQLKLLWSELSRIVLKLLSSERKERLSIQEIVERDTLLKMAQKLSSSLKLDVVLKQMVDALHKIVHFDNAVVFLSNTQKGRLEYEIASGFPEDAKDKLNLKLGEGITGWVARTGHARITPDVRLEKMYYQADPHTKSEIAVPIKKGSKTIGVFMLGSHRLNAFNQRQKQLLEAFAGSAGIAIENARLYQETLQKRELEQDLSVAKRIQKALLQRRVPELNQLEISAYNKPCKQVGGDLYNVIQISENKIVIAVGDISGKGVPAALLMATLQAIFRTEIRRELKIDAFIKLLNEQFFHSIEVGLFATLFHSVLNLAENRLEYCNAGHNPAILFRQDGENTLLGSTSIVLGLSDNAEFTKKNVAFEPGDVLVAYSDGVTEAENANDELFGEQRLIDIVRKSLLKNSTQIKNSILNEIIKFSGKVIPQDDITIVVVKYKK